MDDDGADVAGHRDVEAFRFGGGNLTFLIIFYEAMIVAAVIGGPLLAARFLIAGNSIEALIETALLLAIFLGPILYFLFPTARTYRRARGQQLQVDDTGLSLPDANLHLPWAALYRVHVRSHKRWRYIEIERVKKREDVANIFRAFNENVPCTIAFMKENWIGFTSGTFQHAGSDEHRFLAAIERHAPRLTQ